MRVFILLTFSFIKANRHTHAYSELLLLFACCWLNQMLTWKMTDLLHWPEMRSPVFEYSGGSFIHGGALSFNPGFQFVNPEKLFGGNLQLTSWANFRNDFVSQWRRNTSIPGATVLLVVVLRSIQDVFLGLLLACNDPHSTSVVLHIIQCIFSQIYHRWIAVGNVFLGICWWKTWQSFKDSLVSRVW